jgi:hypothetical protein
MPAPSLRFIGAVATGAIAIIGPTIITIAPTGFIGPTGTIAHTVIIGRAAITGPGSITVPAAIAAGN